MSRADKERERDLFTMSRKFTVPVGSEARERPFPSEVNATRRRGAKSTSEDTLYFPGDSRESLGEDSSSLFKVCSLTFKFSHHGNAWTAVTAIMVTLPLRRQGVAKHTDMVSRSVTPLTRCTYSQLLLQESSPNEESLDKMRGTSQTTDHLLLEVVAE
ncbi:hypothetical protein INR49_018730 [Caranx melampygus]|nr:hypothetical protein INR49_018730 [Caranx melampygus]